MDELALGKSIIMVVFERELECKEKVFRMLLRNFSIVKVPVSAFRVGRHAATIAVPASTIVQKRTRAISLSPSRAGLNPTVPDVSSCHCIDSRLVVKYVPTTTCMNTAILTIDEATALKGCCQS